MNSRFRPDNTKQRLDQMLLKLKGHDFRITPQQLAVLKVLAASEDHPSVEAIYEKVKSEFPTTVSPQSTQTDPRNLGARFSGGE